MRLEPGLAGQIITVLLSPCEDLAPGTGRVDFAKRNGCSLPRASRQRRLSRNARWGACASEQPRRQVRPEEDLGVSGHPALEGRTAVVVAGRDVVMRSRQLGAKQAPIARPSQPEGEIDVLVIRAVERVEATEPLQASAR